MNDQQLDAAWTTLTPDARQRDRIEAHIATWLDAADTSVAAEWLGLFRVAPATAFSLVVVCALAILATTPFGMLARVAIAR